MAIPLAAVLLRERRLSANVPRTARHDALLWSHTYLLRPWAAVITAGAADLAVAACITLALLVGGGFSFRRMEKTFADVV